MWASEKTDYSRGQMLAAARERMNKHCKKAKTHEQKLGTLNLGTNARYVKSL